MSSDYKQPWWREGFHWVWEPLNPQILCVPSIKHAQTHTHTHANTHIHTHTHTHTSGQQHNPVKLMNGYTLGPFKQQMLIHFTWALSDHLCQATEYEWQRLSQIWGLCWQTPPSCRPLGNTPDYCQCVCACVKKLPFCLHVWRMMFLQKDLEAPLDPEKWCLMGNRAEARVLLLCRVSSQVTQLPLWWPCWWPLAPGRQWLLTAVASPNIQLGGFNKAE